MGRKPKTYPELDAVRDLMGTMPDADIAVQANTSAAKVGRYRRKHGIKAYEGYKFGIREGGASASTGAGKPKTERKTSGKQKRKSPGRPSKIAPFRAKVGKVPDREVAELAGVTPEAVRMFRRRHDIALEATRSPAAASGVAKKPRRRKSKLDPYQDLLGKVPDAEVAAMANVTSENVRAYRRRHSIEAEWRRSTPPAEPPKAAVVRSSVAPVAASSGTQAYAVIVEGKDDVFIVLASNFVAAANEAAARVGDVRILSLEHIGSVL
ncbi:MAG: hypothetical protein VX265_03210 [Myxococcota bacterium]|nr:hypothetical protein [Myxococcota bacterium]